MFEDSIGQTIMGYLWLLVLLNITVVQPANWHVNIGVRIGNIDDGLDYITAPGKANIAQILHAMNERISNVKTDLDKNTYSDSVAMYGVSTVSVLALIVGFLMRYIRARVRNIPYSQSTTALHVANPQDRNQIV